MVVLVLAIGLVSPIAYVETACRGGKPTAGTQQYRPIISAEHRRLEARTLLTYPEWHIVHIYDDYARVIKAGAPHDFGYWQGISEFWSALCTLSRTAAHHGGFDGDTKLLVYTVGVSITAELALKAAYEETVGRIAVWFRGETPAPLDTLSAQQAAGYARFLLQTPWYRWDFAGDAAQLAEQNSGSFRDWERRLALGIEFGTKAAYADAIGAAVAATGYDQLRIRMIVRDIGEDVLSSIPEVEVKSRHPEGIEIETPRYRAFRHTLQRLADEGAEFIEIAGNDEILITVISDNEASDALITFNRQGYGDKRHLILLPIAKLATEIREMRNSGRKLEHVHDY